MEMRTKKTIMRRKKMRREQIVDERRRQDMANFLEIQHNWHKYEMRDKQCNPAVLRSFEFIIL